MFHTWAWINEQLTILMYRVCGVKLEIYLKSNKRTHETYLENYLYINLHIY